MQMKLEAEGVAARDNPTEKQVRALVAKLRSYGPTSFASLTDASGNYLQLAGGLQSCLLERRDAISGTHFRAYRSKKHPVFEDGTILSFGGGNIKLQADEWLPFDLVADAFVCFLRESDLPPSLLWRDVTSSMQAIVHR